MCVQPIGESFHVHIYIYMYIVLIPQWLMMSLTCPGSFNIKDKTNTKTSRLYDGFRIMIKTRLHMRVK